MVSKGDLLTRQDVVFKVLEVIDRPVLKIQNLANDTEADLLLEDLESQGFIRFHSQGEVEGLVNRIKELEALLKARVEAPLLQPNVSMPEISHPSKMDLITNP